LIEVGRDYVARTSDRLRNQYVAAETKKLGWKEEKDEKCKIWLLLYYLFY
jgi:hypothetical protein